SGVDHHVSQHLDGAASEHVDDVTGLGALRTALRLSPGNQHNPSAPEVGDPNIIVSVNGNAPRYADRVATGEAHRRGLSAVGPDHVDRACRLSALDVLWQVLARELKLLHDRYAVGDDWRGEIEGHVARYP